ncbi:MULTISPECIES: hypothetical protein [unclassified Microbacterium]|uniref:hypothetical protein n=1 Tax=unclassified Microbacterium TaxID=2609290 RepID=UPI003015A5A5
MNTAAATAATILDLTRALPEVVAGSMIYAQGYVPTRDEHAAIVALADAFEALGLSRRVRVRVHDFQGARIGSLDFHL